MPSLKEVKNRITSVQSTRKITSAMKMVASSKLHRAQQTIENLCPYEKSINSIMSQLVSNVEDYSSAYTNIREFKKIAIIAVSSNSSLCGGFNQNIIKQVIKLITSYKKDGYKITVIPIGKKIGEAIKKLGFSFEDDYAEMLDHLSYEKASSFAKKIIKSYCLEEFDKIEIVYNHFKNTSTQILTTETFLPIISTQTGRDKDNQRNNAKNIDYIIEPSPKEVLEELIPISLRLKIYTVLCDSLASEHSARVIAMQVATDNADSLLQELTLTYNKTRQQAITNELLDIVGGSLK